MRRSLLEGLGGEPAAITCGAAVLLIVSHYQGSTSYLRTVFGSRFDGYSWSVALGYFWWFGCSFVLYLVMPLVLAVAIRGNFHQRYGFQWGDWRLGFKLVAVLLAVMLPATYLASTLGAFRGMYPLAGKGAYLLNLGAGKTETSWLLFATYEAAYCLYFVAWEFFFRGWMLHGLVPHWGKGPAILVQTLPFAIMHLGKPEMEALGSIVAGLALGMVSLRTRSFVYGALVHCAVAVTMDWLSVRTALLGA